jgi:hypothetical protein
LGEGELLLYIKFIQNSSCGQFNDDGHNFVQFWPPNFEGKMEGGKFFVQCEIVQNEGENEVGKGNRNFNLFNGKWLVGDIHPKGGMDYFYRPNNSR